MVQDITAATKKNLRPIRVLLVEDNPIDVRLLSADFERIGAKEFELIAVERLSEAIRVLGEIWVDVVLLDLFLEDAVGLQALATIRRAAPDAPIVVLTGVTDEDLALQALKSGAQDYLMKGSVDTRSVFRAIRYAIERKRTEEALRNSEQRYRDLFQNANDSIYMIDNEGNFTAANSTYQRITGYDLDELVGRKIQDVVVDLYHETLRRVIDAQARGSKPVVCELEFLAKDGHRIPVEVSSQLIYEHGKPTGIQGIARDLSERKALEHRLREKQKLEAVGTLSGGVAHNFNNILTIVLGHCNLLLEQMDGDNPSRSNIEAIKRAGERAAVLTRQLLAFNRKQALKPELTNLNDVVVNMQQLLETVLGENINLHLELAAKLGQVTVDRRQIEQIIMNLAMNARDAMPDGGLVTILTAEAPYLDALPAASPDSPANSRVVMLSIRDTGCGMSEETRSHIFEPFFTTKGMAQASGLGLSTVYGLVNQNSGIIDVTSSLGEGTAFSIVFPVAESSSRSKDGLARARAILAAN